MQHLTILYRENTRPGVSVGALAVSHQGDKVTALRWQSCHSACHVEGALGWAFRRLWCAGTIIRGLREVLKAEWVEENGDIR